MLPLFGLRRSVNDAKVFVNLSVFVQGLSVCPSSSQSHKAFSSCRFLRKQATME